MKGEILTLAQVADLLRVKYARAAELACRGILPHFRLGRQIRASRSELDSFIERSGRALPGGWRRAPVDATRG